MFLIFGYLLPASPGRMLRLILLAATVVGCHGSQHNYSHMEVDPYIVGGEQISIGQIPYHLALEKGKRYHCGASIIGEHWALTAAHCVRVERPDQLKIRSGSDLVLEGGELHQVVEVIVNEKSSNNSFDYDLAVMRVDKPFNRKHVIGLANVRPAPGTLATVSGWGRIRDNGPASKHLRWVQVPLVEQTKCEVLNADALIKISERMFCAGYTEGGKDACQGDSGGPLVVGEVQVGIVSNGRGCAMPSFGVYTDVAKEHSWIVEKTGV